MAIEQVAALIGVGQSTFRGWMADDEDFKAWVKRHEAQGELHHAEVIRDGGMGGGTTDNGGGAGAKVAASKFYLSTRRHRNWVPAQELQHAGAVALTDLMDADPADDSAEVET